MSNTYIHNYLTQSYTSVIRDPLWTSIHYDPLFTNIFTHPVLQKLFSIKQLGPTYLVYPGATHTRYSHSVGVMHIARKILSSLIIQKNCPKFSISSVRSFILAALLHDIGHFPYTHSLKELPLPEHEDISADLIISQLSKAITKSGGIPHLVAAIIAHNYKKYYIPKSKLEKTQLTIFRNILSGALDPDKLDYLCRDALFCGVPYGIQDVDFIVHHLKLSNALSIICTSPIPMEHLLFSKYLMYKSVYWHQKVRSATSMIKHALFHAIKESVIKPKELLYLTDEEFTSFCLSRSHGCKRLELASSVAHGNIYTLIAEYAVTNIADIFIKKLENLDIRSKAETLLMKKLDNNHIIIDFPEPIWFELPPNIHSLEKNKSLFLDTHTISLLVQQLRKIRIFAPHGTHMIHSSVTIKRYLMGILKLL